MRKVVKKKNMLKMRREKMKSLRKEMRKRVQRKEKKQRKEMRKGVKRRKKGSMRRMVQQCRNPPQICDLA